LVQRKKAINARRTKIRGTIGGTPPSGRENKRLAEKLMQTEQALFAHERVWKKVSIP